MLKIAIPVNHCEQKCSQNNYCIHEEIFRFEDIYNSSNKRVGEIRTKLLITYGAL